MYYLSKRIEISFAHRLTLNYESKCTRLHGHNAIITVYCCAQELNENGMVVDFTTIRRIVSDAFDHVCLNDLVPFNPTAENMAKFLCEKIPHCYKVSFRESEGNEALYVKDEFVNAPL